MIVPAFLLFFAPAVSDDLIERSLRQVVDVFAAAQEHAADPVAADRSFYEGAIPGMLRRLDPHSVFFDAAQFEQLKDLEKSTRKGFGSVVSLLPGRVIVLQALPGTPSAKAGLQPGDEILSVNGYRLDRLEVEQLVQLLTESRQRQAMLEVKRPGNARLMQFVMTPEDVDSPSVDRAFLLRPDTGYLRVTSFDAGTGKLIRDTIETLGGAKLKGLVIDLRDNPGGLMPAALETSSLFLEAGRKIVSVRGRTAKSEDIEVPKEMPPPYRFPVAILINGKSASASEIVAGALQDHKRAVVIGEPSFGKGLVQSVYPLSQGTGMALTVAFYYTPNGRSIQRRVAGQLESATATAGTGGIQPDRTVHPELPTRFRAVLEATASFTSFATDLIARERRISPQFQVTSEVLDAFQVALSQRNIRPSLSEWSREREWIRSRVRQEVLNQALGVAKGDEVEFKRDPVVLAALEAIQPR